MSKNGPRLKKWLIRVAKLIVVLGILWWVWGSLADGWQQLKDRDQGQWHWQPAWLLLAAGLYLVGLAPFGLFWYRILHQLGQEARLGETLRAYYIGHLGKYVPGKAMVVILRAGLIRSHRVDTAIAAVSVFFETLTMMAVGACAAAAYLAIFFREQAVWSLGAAGLMIVALIPTLPPVFKRLVRLAKRGKIDAATSAKLEALGFSTLFVGWLFSLIGWLLLGLSYWATLRALGIDGLDPVAHLPRYVAGVALAVVAGFLLLILPGGLAVREMFLAGLVTPYLKELGHPHADLTAWASAFLLRLIWTVSELLISGILYVCGSRAEPPITETGSPDSSPSRVPEL